MNSLRNAVSSGPGRIIFMLAGIAILAVVLYYLYKYINGSTEKSDMVVYSNAGNGIPANSTNTTKFEKENIPAIYGGGDYSISTWIYVSNWNIQKGKNKIFLTLDGGGDNKTLVMYLGQFVNKLGIRVSNTGTATTNTIGPSQMTLLSNGSSPYTDDGGDFKKCDIESIDMQRWVHICTVLSGRTMDVYIDGKLARSCVLDGMFTVSGTTPKMEIGGPKGFGGIIGQTHAANFAYSPDHVYRLYSNGPVDTSLWTLFKSYFDPGQYSFSLKRNGESIASGSTV